MLKGIQAELEAIQLDQHWCTYNNTFNVTRKSFAGYWMQEIAFHKMERGILDNVTVTFTEKRSDRSSDNGAASNDFNSYAPFSYSTSDLPPSRPLPLFFSSSRNLLAHLPAYVRLVSHACFQLFISLSGAWFTCECLALTDASSATNYQPSHH